MKDKRGRHGKRNFLLFLYSLAAFHSKVQVISTYNYHDGQEIFCVSQLFSANLCHFTHFVISISLPSVSLILYLEVKETQRETDIDLPYTISFHKYPQQPELVLAKAKILNSIQLFSMAGRDPMTDH